MSMKMEQLNRPPAWLAISLTTPLTGWVALLGRCVAYLRGGIDNAADFASAVEEIRSFGIYPAPLITVAATVKELGGAVLILTGIDRWLGALWLAGYTFIASFRREPVRKCAIARSRTVQNGFFVQLGPRRRLPLLAWIDMRSNLEESGGFLRGAECRT
jgi:uncharacterized membrane protein YphA (DoxX/SURF4 family)